MIDPLKRGDRLYLRKNATDSPWNKNPDKFLLWHKTDNDLYLIYKTSMQDRAADMQATCMAMGYPSSLVGFLNILPKHWLSKVILSNG